MPELKPSTPIDSAAFAPLRQAALEQAQSFELPVLHDDASGVSVQSVYGRMTLRVDRRGACAAEAPSIPAPARIRVASRTGPRGHVPPTPARS